MTTRRRAPALRLWALTLGAALSAGGCLRAAAGGGAQAGGLALTAFALTSAPAAAAGALMEWLAPADAQGTAAPAQEELPAAAAAAPSTHAADAAAPAADTGRADAADAGMAAPAAPAAPQPPAADKADGSAAAPADTQPAPQGWLPVREAAWPCVGEGERFVPLAAGSVHNLTQYTAAQVLQAADAGLPFALDAADPNVQVLIMHTHATECYAEREGLVRADNNGRTTDTAQNMAAVGAALAQRLRQQGIPTAQDTTLHDWPSYGGSYQRSCATVQQWLQQCPGIRVVLDIHRDALEADGVRLAPTALIDGRKAAQLMIICGADDGTMDMPDFFANLGFACALESALESDWPGLTRPLLFDYRNYNQQLTTGSLLIEIGGHGNTLEQALYTADLLGQTLARLLSAG